MENGLEVGHRIDTQETVRWLTHRDNETAGFVWLYFDDASIVLSRWPMQLAKFAPGFGDTLRALAYQALIGQFDMRASMSRRGNCYDAPIESFWSTLKNELVYHQRFATREQARLAINEYIEIFYSRKRTQARLNYRSLVAFTQRFYLNQIAA